MLAIVSIVLYLAAWAVAAPGGSRRGAVVWDILVEFDSFFFAQEVVVEGALIVLLRKLKIKILTLRYLTSHLLWKSSRQRCTVRLLFPVLVYCL